MKKERKSRAYNPRYVSPSQGVLPGFEHPFERELDLTNRWVVLSHLIPWDELCNIYLKQMGIASTGRRPINPRIVLGALIIKYICNLDDRETVDQISENIYMQYFLGYPSFINDKPFDASLFVEIRKRFGMESINAMNEKIIQLKAHFENKKQSTKKETPTSACPKDASLDHPFDFDDKQRETEEKSSAQFLEEKSRTQLPEEKPSAPLPKEEHKGSILFDATACPQDIAYPTDLDLLSDAREKSEELIDLIYKKELHCKKPRTYREVARKEYLHTAQKKKKTTKQIRSAVRKQLDYLKRNISSLNHLLDSYKRLPFDKYERKYFYVIQTLYEQQLEMYRTRTHTIEHRIVSIHQPHVRPIVRGKLTAPVEFGAKIHLSLIDGISFLDELSWDAFNEGSHMEQYVENYRKRFGFFPREVIADQIYCTKANRSMLKSKGSGILLKGKPLGKSSASAVSIHVSPGERNPIEGKFGQAKSAYGLNRIKARLKITSESWIAGIILVLNLVKLAGAVAPRSFVNDFCSFSANMFRLPDSLFTYIHNMYRRNTDHSSIHSIAVAA